MDEKTDLIKPTKEEEVVAPDTHAVAAAGGRRVFLGGEFLPRIALKVEPEWVGGWLNELEENEAV